MNGYPLLQSQLGVVAHCNFYNDSTYYNLPFIVELSSDIDLKRLADAWKRLFLLRPVFRTRFKISEDGHFIQFIDDEMDIPVTIRQCSHEELLNYIENDFVRPFDLFGDEPLTRVELVETEKGPYLLWDIHHSISDYTVINKVILQEDLSQLYETMTLPEEEYTLEDAVNEEQNSFSSDEYQASKDYLLGKFSQSNFISLGNENLDNFGEMIWAHSYIDMEECDEWCRKHSAKPIMLFQAAFSHVISLITRNDDFAYWTVYHNRFDPKLWRCYGMHAKSIPIKNVNSKNITVIDYLRKSYDEMKSAIIHSNYPFTHFCKELGVAPSLFFNFVAKKDVNYDVLIGGHKFQLIHLKRNDSNYAVTVQIGLKDSNYEIRVESGKNVLSERGLRLISESMANVINNMMMFPYEDLSRMPIIPLNDMDAVRELVELGKGKEMPIKKEDNIISEFKQKTSEQPDSVAVGYGSNEFTYSQIDEMSDVVSSVLAEKAHIGKGDVVGVYISRSEKMITYPLGIMKLGAIFLPLDIKLPYKRIETMCSDADVKAIITDLNLDMNDEFSEIILDENDFDFDKTVPEVTPDIQHEDGAVILYTSGSTGKPKGVKLIHRGLVNYFNWIRDELKITEEDRFSAFSSFGFDAHLIDIYAALTSGASVHIMSDEIKKDIDLILKFLKDNKITLGFFTTRIAYLLNGIDHPLRFVLTGGEKIHPLEVENYQLVNGYGPTECTIYTTTYNVSGEYDGSVIGRPLPNYQLFVVDRNNNLLPIGLVGELLIGGNGLSQGYINMPDVSKERFIDFNPCKGIDLKVYKSGDLVYYDEEGNVVFIGRDDKQVKLRGFRIELDEIEKTASRYAGIGDVAVDVKNDVLCIYYTSDFHISKELLEEFLSQNLPEYMVPSYYKQLEELPLNINSKVDRDMLPNPSFERNKEYEPPEGMFEKLISYGFSEVLNISHPIDRDDEFSKLGGNSISVMMLISWLREKKVEISVKDVLDNQSVRKIAKNAKFKISSNEISQEPYVGKVDLTPITKYFWDMKLANPSYFNQSILFSASKRIDVEMLKKAMLTVINHHDMLRAVIKDNNIHIGEIGEREYFTIEVCEAPDYQSETERINREIDLFNGPLIKLAIFRQDNEDELYIVMHHLLVDGISWRIISEDLNLVYAQLLHNGKISLPLKTSCYQDYALAIDKYASSEKLLEQKDYWDNVINQIKNSQYTKITSKRRMKRIDLKFSRNKSSVLLSNFSQWFDTSINAIFISAIFKAWKKVIGENELSLRVEGHGREYFDEDLLIDRTVGWFTSCYPVFLKSDAENINEIIDYVGDNLSNIPQKGFGFPILKGINTREIPLFTFNYLGEMSKFNAGEMFVPTYREDLANFTASENNYGSDINLNGYSQEHQIHFQIDYNSEKFSEQTILEFKNEFINNLEEIINANKDIIYKDDVFFFSNHPDKKNLVFIHPASYGSEFFHYMAERIKDDYSFSVIEHYNLNHQESQLTSIEELAEKYIDILKSIQPEGPYYLGGVCFGGAVAHEMAIQLEKNGEIVEKLIIMDAHNIEDNDLQKLIIQDQALHAREYMDEGMINEKVTMEDMVYNARLTSKLWLDYKPGYYGGDVLYFRATKRPEDVTPAADKLYDYVLSRKCGGYEGVLDDEKLFIVEIPVEHNDIISQEALEYIVPSLREFIYDGDL